MSSTLSVPLVPPPICIPSAAPRRDAPPRPNVKHYAGEEEHIPYDFPSPISLAPLLSTRCVLCDIAFCEAVPTRDGDTCTSCETLYRNYRIYNTPLPSCYVCEAQCYYIHRLCGKSICDSCKYNFQACPHCKSTM